MEVIVDSKLGLARKLFATVFVQDNRRGKILAFARHGNHAHILHKARLLDSVFNFGERDALFFDFHDRIGAALKQESAIVIKVNQVARRKAFGFENIARLDIQTFVFGKAHLADFKRSPHSPIFRLPICNATRFGTAINFHGPVSRKFACSAGHLNRERATRRINHRSALKADRLIGFGRKAFQECGARGHDGRFRGNARKFCREIDTTPAEREACCNRQEGGKQEAVNVVMVNRAINFAVHPVITENLYQFKKFIFELQEQLVNSLRFASRARGVHDHFGFRLVEFAELDFGIIFTCCKNILNQDTRAIACERFVGQESIFRFLDFFNKSFLTVCGHECTESALENCQKRDREIVGIFAMQDPRRYIFLFQEMTYAGNIAHKVAPSFAIFAGITCAKANQSAFGPRIFF